MNILFNRYIEPFDENILSIEIHCIEIYPHIYAAKVIYKDGQYIEIPEENDEITNEDD